MYFLDFSQVELRMQAHYTLPFGGDVNMCRAYMPYHCFHYRTGEEYNFQTIEGRGRWNEKQEDGETSDWIEKDTNEP
jgi:DNA polymerase-1